MKRQIANLLGIFGLLLVAACANAQSLNVKANIPFDFAVDKASLPAGEYSIQALSTGTGKVLHIQGEAGQMLVLANSAATLNAPPNTRLVFHKYGDQYLLSQIWVAGENAGRQLRMTRREAEIAKNVPTSQDVIVLAALR